MASLNSSGGGDDDRQFKALLEQHPEWQRLYVKEEDESEAGIMSDRSFDTDDDDDAVYVDKDPDLNQYETQKTKKGNKKETFRCNFCDMVINSRHTMRAHRRGYEHRNKVREARNDHALGYRTDPVPEFEITQIPNPGAMRKKAPLRMQVKLKHISEPVVGLEFIDEFLPITNDEVEPYYECFLCPKQSEANGMATHVASADHIRNYFIARFPGKEVELKNAKRPNLIKLATKHDQKDRPHLVTTYESDLLFRWPVKKSPWCTEAGGDGAVPPNAREVVQIETTDEPIWVKLRERRSQAKEMIKTLRLPATKNLGQISNDDEAADALDCLEVICAQLASLKSETADPVQKKKIERDLAALAITIAQKRNTLSPKLRRQPRPAAPPPSAAARPSTSGYRGPERVGPRDRSPGSGLHDYNYRSSRR